MSKLDPTFGLPIDVTTRKKGVFYVEVIRSNPNGDPNAEGAPRVLPSEHGLITNACVKRVVRDFAHNIGGQPLYVARGADLTEVQERHGKDRDRMVASLWDLRPFGGSLTASGDRVCGAVQFSDAVSIDPVDIEEVRGTRVGGHTRTRKGRGDDAADEEFLGANMFKYKVVSYGLYRGEFTLDPFKAKQVGLTEADLALLYAGLIEGFEYTRSAHRTGVNLRRLYVFDYPSARGTEPSHVTAARVKATKRPEVGMFPTRFEDYEIAVNDVLPAGMTLSRWEDGVVGASAAAK